MNWSECSLSGVRLCQLPQHRDSRGELVKLHHADWLAYEGIRFEETFYTRSVKGALRGMHFQYPPFDHWKFLTCVAGRILDVCLDLRWNSPTRGNWMALEMTQDRAVGLLLPPGIAHGFLALSEDAMVMYHCSCVQAKESEGGVHWQSFGYDWPMEAPVLSERDQHLPPLQTVLADPRMKEFGK